MEVTAIKNCASQSKTQPPEKASFTVELIRLVLFLTIAPMTNHTDFKTVVLFFLKSYITSA